jgi:hypothetical protein
VTDADSGGLSGQSTGRGAGRRTGAIGSRFLLVKSGDYRAPAQAWVNRVAQEDSVLIDEADPGSSLLDDGPCLALSADLARGRTAL